LSILTFDPSFSLGEFDVTVSTYKHPLIAFRNPNDHTFRHPSLIGPVLIHQRKQFANYHRKLCTEADESAWKIRPGLVNTASATTVQNQVSINVQSASSTVVMPTHISSLPSSTPGPAIMPSQGSTLCISAEISSVSSSYESLHTCAAPMSPFTSRFCLCGMSSKISLKAHW